MPKQWCIHSHDANRISALARAAGVPAVVAQLLVCRGVTDASTVREFSAR